MPRLSRFAAVCAAVVLTLTAIAHAGEDTAFPPATPESQGLTAEAMQALADAVAGYVEQNHALGGELLVIKNRHTVLHEAFGLRDKERDLPMVRNTIFNIRSMTKPLTGAAAQLLIDRGKLSLDDPVARYLPGFRNEKSEHITIRQLLTHRSGLPLTILSTSVDEYPDLMSMANEAGERGPEFETDSKFWYSDSGTDVVAAVVEAITGETIDKFITRELLKPLGMGDSLYVTDMTDPRIERIASLYVGGAGAWAKYWWADPDGEPMYPCAWGSQTLYSTPMDYARFLAMWMDNGKAGGKQLLSPDAIKRTLTPASLMSTLGSDAPYPTLLKGVTPWYGQMAIVYLADDTAEDGKIIAIGHSGSDGTAALAWPDLDLIICYFTQSRGGLSVLRLEEVIDHHLINPGADEEPEQVPEELKPYIGTYVANFANFRNTEFTVLIKNGRLALDIPGQMAFELKDPDEEGKWYFAMSNAVAVSFAKDESGKVTSMSLHQGGMTFECPAGKAEVIEEVILDPAELQKYVGAYMDEENDRLIKVLIHNGNLALEVPEIDMPLELYPPDKDGLWAIRLDVSNKLKFNEDESGRVVSFSVMLPDGSEAVRVRVEDEDDSSGAAPDDD